MVKIDIITKQSVGKIFKKFNEKTERGEIIFKDFNGYWKTD